MKISINMIGVSFLLAMVLFLSVQFFQKRSRDTTLERIVSVLYRQCARWAVAAEQDKNVIIRVLHANYATGYLWALKDIVSTDVFQKITGEDFLSLEKKVVKIQDTATQELVSICKESVPISDPMLLKAIYQYDTAS